MGCCKCCIIMIAILVLAVAVASGLLSSLFPYPLHASCKLELKVGESCTNSQFEIIQKIKAWEDTPCTEQQRCGYKLITNERNLVTGTRTTETQYVDSFNFTFADDPVGCQIMGYSRSNTWYAVLDFGYNYCNLKNLIQGARLNKANPYEEITSDAICTLYSSAYCRKYDLP